MNEVECATEAESAKLYWSTHHAQSAKLQPRGGDQDHRWQIADYIAAMNPSSVLEFGCSSARNLAALRTLVPTTTDLTGIDANSTALNVGQLHNGDSLELYEGDETLLAQFKDEAFDVVFTVSVLDHVPTPEWRGVYDELVRLAKVAVVLVEPIMQFDRAQFAQRTGLRIEALREYCDLDIAKLGIAAPAFTYVHDYVGHDSALSVVRPQPMIASALSPAWVEFGSMYHLMLRAK